MNSKEQTKKDKKTKEIQKEIRKKIAGYIVGGFALVAGLAWNDAIKTFIEAVFPRGSANTILAKFIYAFLITVLVVIVSMYVTRVLVKEEEEKKK